MMSLLEFAKALEATSLSAAIKSISWIVPLLQSVHILMVGVVFVSILMVALRVVGRVRVDEPLPMVWNRFAPFLWTGLVVMVVTGALLTISEPLRELMTLSFRIKMLLLAIGSVSAFLFGRTMRSAARAAGAATRAEVLAVRVAALATLALWVAIIILGRAIAYDDSVWGSWSPAVLQRGGSL